MSKDKKNTPYIEEFRQLLREEVGLIYEYPLGSIETSLVDFLTKTIESEREKYLKGFIKLGYGKRCKEYEEGCPTCDEWKLYDEYIK